MSAEFDPHSELPIELLLSYKTLPELKALARSMGIKFKGIRLKEEWVRALSKLLIESPELVVKYMFCYELQASLDVIEGKMTLKEAQDSGLLYELNRFGLIYEVIDGESVTTILRFCHELTEPLRALIPAELKRREEDGSLIAEQMALGLANLYGFTDMVYIHEYKPELEKCLGRTLDEKGFMDLMFPVLGLTHGGHGVCSLPFMTPFKGYTGFTIEKPDTVDWSLKAKQFDFDTILSYGKMPYPDIVTPETEAIKKVLKKYGHSSISIEYSLCDIWLTRQGKQEHFPHPLNYMRLTDNAAYDEAMPAYVSYINSLPQWRLRGNSPDDLTRHFNLR